jgi:hypothetical protein
MLRSFSIIEWSHVSGLLDFRLVLTPKDCSLGAVARALESRLEFRVDGNS